MSYQHVEDTESKSGSLEAWATEYSWDGTRHVYRAKSKQTIAHSVWRCSHCRALCVTQKGSAPPAKCGKCGC